jgi:hypothetical protein
MGDEFFVQRPDGWNLEVISILTIARREFLETSGLALYSSSNVDDGRMYGLWRWLTAGRLV